MTVCTSITSSLSASVNQRAAVQSLPLAAGCGLESSRHMLSAAEVACISSKATTSLLSSSRSSPFPSYPPWNRVGKRPGTSIFVAHFFAMITLLTLNALDVCVHKVVFRDGVPHPVQDTTSTQNRLPGRTEPCGRCSCSFIILTPQHCFPRAGRPPFWDAEVPKPLLCW